MKGKKRNKIKFQSRLENCGTFSGSCDSRPWIEESRKVGYHEVDGHIPVSEEAKNWQGWGTALKPSQEPICLARKPLSEPTIAANVLKWGTGALNIDGCRIETGEDLIREMGGGKSERKVYGNFAHDSAEETVWHGSKEGRWPANLCHDGSEEVKDLFPETKSGKFEPHHNPERKKNTNVYGKYSGLSSPAQPFGGDEGSAARFFYCAKAGRLDRIERPLRTKYVYELKDNTPQELIDEITKYIK